ncbi:uncharacterized protein SCHCODRAFT_02497452 [Schizophyllum commune H4-8]|uniref:Uncharacterized protein n=1 Tax=Schizophyllum commune (strain H4-8 / FGSC 9210) TaxID=578458 RepID=D8Q2E5_SCHCM|nr:uncharacterized protein SCHCODRAFT_02497452 [Schizophyllum commune H4-8]KAI5895833.1 hypothetical protein SCHCODRAFT_02497452 [Schizophyllum commune H4-8]
MHPRPRIRSSQHIELVFNHQFYDVADREPLPLGPLASLGPIRTARRPRPSPYPHVHSRRTSASPVTSRQTSPSSVEPDRAMSPVALHNRASISDLDYAEDSDDNDGLSQGRAIGRQPYVLLRPEISLDSSSDDWLEHADNRLRDDGHAADAAPATAASFNEKQQPSTRTARRSPQASSVDCAQPASTARDRASSRARDHAPLTTRTRSSSGARDRVPPSAQELASSTARTGSPQPRVPLLHVVPEAGSTKIPKPPGAPGRSENGEYDLEEELGWSLSKYRDVMGTINELVEKHLQCDKSITKQLPERYSAFEAQATARYPELDDYEDRWPVRAFAVNHLRYLQNNPKRVTRKRPARI